MAVPSRQPAGDSFVSDLEASLLQGVRREAAISTEVSFATSELAVELEEERRLRRAIADHCREEKKLRVSLDCQWDRHIIKANASLDAFNASVQYCEAQEEELRGVRAGAAKDCLTMDRDWAERRDSLARTFAKVAGLDSSSLSLRRAVVACKKFLEASLVEEQRLLARLEDLRRAAAEAENRDDVPEAEDSLLIQRAALDATHEMRMKVGTSKVQQRIEDDQRKHFESAALAAWRRIRREALMPNLFIRLQSLQTQVFSLEAQVRQDDGPIGDAAVSVLFDCVNSAVHALHTLRHTLSLAADEEAAADLASRMFSPGATDAEPSVEEQFIAATVADGNVAMQPAEARVTVAELRAEAAEARAELAYKEGQTQRMLMRVQVQERLIQAAERRLAWQEEQRAIKQQRLDAIETIARSGDSEAVDQCFGAESTTVVNVVSKTLAALATPSTQIEDDAHGGVVTDAAKAVAHAVRVKAAVVARAGVCDALNLVMRGSEAAAEAANEAAARAHVGSEDLKEARESLSSVEAELRSAVAGSSSPLNLDDVFPALPELSADQAVRGLEEFRTGRASSAEQEGVASASGGDVASTVAAAVSTATRLKSAIEHESRWELAVLEAQPLSLRADHLARLSVEAHYRALGTGDLTDMLGVAKSELASRRAQFEMQRKRLSQDEAQVELLTARYREIQARRLQRDAQLHEAVAEVDRMESQSRELQAKAAGVEVYLTEYEQAAADLEECKARNQEVTKRVWKDKLRRKKQHNERESKEKELRTALEAATKKARTSEQDLKKEEEKYALERKRLIDSAELAKRNVIRLEEIAVEQKAKHEAKDSELQQELEELRASRLARQEWWLAEQKGWMDSKRALEDRARTIMRAKKHIQMRDLAAATGSASNES